MSMQGLLNMPLFRHVSHELRTPLSIMMVGARMLMQEGNGGGDGKDEGSDTREARMETVQDIYESCQVHPSPF